MTKDELIEHFKKSSALPDNWMYIDDSLLRSAMFTVLPMHQEEVVDYDNFLSGKTAIAYGVTPNEKRWLRRHVTKHNGKFRFTYCDGIDIYIMSSVSYIYNLQMALEAYHRKTGTVFIDYDLFIRHFDDIFDDDKEEEIKAKEREEEERAKATRKPQYEVCTEQYLNTLPKVSQYDLDLDNDVFHVIGNTEDALWNSHEGYKKFYKTQELYDLIADKGGRFVKKEESPNITCVVYGSKPSMRHIRMYEERVKLISVVKFAHWMEQQDTITAACKVFEKSYHSSVDRRLRPYQQEMKDKVFRHWNRHFNVMLQLPTGTGKTVLFTSIINDLVSVKDTKIVILAHRKELIDQISEHLIRYDIDHGVITSGRKRDLEKSVQVASVQTLTHEKNIDLLDELKPKFIIIDEAHHSLADSYTKFWKHCGDCWKLGVTATPYRLNCRSFMSHFDKLIESEKIDQFISQGYLSEYDFLVDNPNSSLSQTIKAIKEKSSTGDYKTATLLKELNVPQHIQRLVVCYEQYVNGKKGIVYAINKEHAHSICEAYLAIGVIAVYIDSDTPKRERAEIVERFSKSEIQVMVNVDIFSEGFDCPDVEFIQLARPTWSLAKYLQQVGRGMRPCESKQKTVILDNARMFVKFGLPSEERMWIWYFTGHPYAKDLYKQENSQNEANLRLVCRYNEEMMVKMNDGAVNKAEQQRQQEEAERRFAEAKAEDESKRREREEAARRKAEEESRQAQELDSAERQHFRQQQEEKDIQRRKRQRSEIPEWKRKQEEQWRANHPGIYSEEYKRKDGRNKRDSQQSEYKNSWLIVLGYIVAASVLLTVIWQTGLLIPLGLIGLATSGLLKR